MEDLRNVFNRLYERFGPQRWWPGDSPFEIILGAVLTQNTNWKNVEKALAELRHAGALNPAAIQRLSEAELAELIRSAGYYRLKSRRVKNVVRFIMENYGGCVETMLAKPPSELRNELLQINGIGPETADSILLYAAGQPVFVVDAYTARMLVRHGWIDTDADYHRIQDLFHSSLPDDVPLMNEFHALIVRLGKTYCKKQPQCDGCPLEILLPEQGVCQSL